MFAKFAACSEISRKIRCSAFVHFASRLSGSWQHTVLSYVNASVVLQICLAVPDCVKPEYTVHRTIFGRQNRPPRLFYSPFNQNSRKNGHFCHSQPVRFNETNLYLDYRWNEIHHVISVAASAEISLWSPWKLFIFIIKKYIYRISVSQKNIFLILKRTSLHMIHHEIRLVWTFPFGMHLSTRSRITHSPFQTFSLYS